MVQGIGDAVKIAGQSIERTTLNGIQVASAETGVSFQYLLAQAAQESDFKTDARASTSSAAGLFQFTRGTWLSMVKRYGAEHGLQDLADKITDYDGVLSVANKATEREILSLRDDAGTSALMAAHYAEENAYALETVLGRPVDGPDLYLAHFLGASGATSLLSAAETDPDKPAAAVLPAAAHANSSVFYTPSLVPRTVAEVVDLVRERFAGQMDRYAEVADAVAPEPVPEPVPASLPASAAPSPSARFAFDFRAARAAGDTERMSVSWFVLQQLAELIAQHPMRMMEDEEDTSRPQSPGFQGADWSSALVDQFTRDSGLTAAGVGARAYAKVGR